MVAQKLAPFFVRLNFIKAKTCFLKHFTYLKTAGSDSYFRQQLRQ